MPTIVFLCPTVYGRWVPRSEWSGEILFPAANAEGYRLVFEAETWLRRICLAALLLADGPAWATTLEPDLRRRLENQSKSNSARWYLGVDAEEELLWSTTHSQLADLLRLRAVGSRLNELCGLSGEVLANRLLSVSQVRNVLAHNRAISDDTLVILKGDLTIIRAGVSRFKGNTLYADSDIVSSSYVPDDLALLTTEFNVRSDEFPHQQLYLAANHNFLFLVRLPVPPFGRWPNAGQLRKALGMASHLMLCAMANKQGDELQLVIPRALRLKDKLEVLGRFMTEAVLRDAWIEKPSELQHPADVCWPRLWFYENRYPALSEV